MIKLRCLFFAMTDTLAKLKDILGEDRLKELTVEDDEKKDSEVPSLINAKEIFCECNILILKPLNARLILPTESMLEVEKDLKFLQHSDRISKTLARGCYWLVDDMYKFEQMGYTKEFNFNDQQKKPCETKEESSSNPKEENEQQQSQQDTFQPADNKKQLNSSTLRWLACAECNLCPLGWYDSETKESYLYVW